MNKHTAAIFLDRDGTLIEDVGVLTNSLQISLFEDTIESLLLLQNQYKLFVFTNQPGISQKKVSFEQVQEINEHLNEIFKRHGVQIEKWYVCPHERKENCTCIKPNPTFLFEAAKEFGLSLRESFFIGDHPHDVTTGENAEAFGIYLLTGHGHHHLNELPTDKLVFNNISEAANWILEHPNHKLDFYKSIQKGANAIKEGGLVVFPTETVYGLGADALNQNAVANIFRVKKRPLHDPLIVHISDKSQIDQLVKDLPGKAKLLIEHFWPGPLTLVLPKSEKVPDIVTAGLDTVAVRMPQNPWALELIKLAGTPIAAPSANLFGTTSPTTAKHVKDQLISGYEVLIDGGASRIGIESTVVSFINDNIKILRPGGISKEQIEELLGPINEIDNQEIQTNKKFHSPGMMSKHYAPSTPFVFTDNIDLYTDRTDVGLILFQSNAKNFQGVVKYLSAEGDDKEAAANLYSTMRNLDEMGLSLIIAEMVPNEGLGIAINDRLRRASSKSMLLLNGRENK